MLKHLMIEEMVALVSPWVENAQRKRLLAPSAGAARGARTPKRVRRRIRRRRARRSDGLRGRRRRRDEEE